MYKHQTAHTAAVVVLFLSVLLSVSFHGKQNRVFSSDITTVAVDTPEKAYSVWKEKGVRGRILLLFDNYPHAMELKNYIRGGGTPQLNSSNLVEFSIFRNIVRKIYYLIPDEQWEDFRQQGEMRPLRPLPGVERGLYLFYKSGVPLIAVSPSSLPHISEKVLVYNNNLVFDPDQSLKLLASKKITSDIIITLQGHR